MMKASALPLTQPDRFTISWTTDFSSDVRCAAVRAPAVGHSDADQAAVAAVFGRLEMSPAAAANAAALSAA
jgi:hypothetical protein